MSIKVYSKYCIDIVFGEGSLGFSLGKTSEGFTVVNDFNSKENGSISPIQGCDVIKRGDYLLAVNSKLVYLMDMNEVNEVIRVTKRPLTIRFAHPCSKLHWKKLFSTAGEELIQKWGDSDLYLPVRSFDLSGMNPCFILQRPTTSIVEHSLTPLYRHGSIFECEVREACFNGLSDPATRASIWKMLLRCYPFQPSQWSKAKQKNTANYLEFIDEFIIQPNTTCGKHHCMEVPNPIDASWKSRSDYNALDDDGISNESKWSREFGDYLIREIIWKDTDRTYSDMAFFGEYNREVLARILFVFSKLNRSVEYVQGMNELLAPLLYAFALEENHELDRCVTITVEADTFFAFNNLISETRDLFISQMDTSTTGLGGVLATLDEHISIYLPTVAARFNELMIKSQFYALRWLTTLYARELQLEQTLRVWDALLADPDRFMMMYCVGIALIDSVKEHIVTADFAQIMKVLQEMRETRRDNLVEAANITRDLMLRKKRGYCDDLIVDKVKRRGWRQLMRGASSIRNSKKDDSNSE